MLYCFIMHGHIVWLIVVAVISHTALPALAEYTLVLKNGRRITVQSYRDEGSVVKIYGLGGELGIPKDQIQTILKAGGTERQGLSLPELETTTRLRPAPTQPPARQPQATEAAGPGESKPSVDSEEAKEYQKRLAEVTQKLETAKQEYFDATQGGGSASNVSKEGLRAWAADLASRIHDSQKTAGSQSGSNPPFPNYSAKEKELSELRIKIDSLQKERDAIIQEMKSKNIPLLINIDR
jgi:hypothetical protein